MAQHPPVIIGAGIGGLTLARCLLKRGLPTVLYEKMPLRPRHGYGITLHASSYRPLLDVLEMDEVAFKRHVAVDGMGAINPKALVHPNTIEPSSFRAHRGKLEDLLRKGLNIQYEHALGKIEQAPDGHPILHFHNNQKLKTNYVIGADGIHSNTRKSTSPTTTELKILPYIAFNGKRRVPRTLFDKLYAPAMIDTNVLETKQNDILLNISINERTPNDPISMLWIYSRPSRGPTDPLYKPNRPLSGATDIPEAFYQEINTLERKNLKQPFKDIFDAEKMSTDRVLHWLMRSLLVSKQDLLNLASKGVFLIGDAAHAQPIIGGQGANAAMRDGVELAGCIYEEGSAGVSKWCEGRYESWVRGVEDGERVIVEMHEDSVGVYSIDG
ncbi:FAD-dependent monooxygenase [Lachnellula occidentalis]|uniref:FAD-dependent monooxygenase n=1 Tax=Lachnellula occidentalis TaxID=215460 RepID=A0A8H8UJU6_9HELO|nr:FAD-dependent monooxygenase [Lachnellula occidentalis]